MKKMKMVVAVSLFFIIPVSQLWAQAGYDADKRAGSNMREGRDLWGQGIKPFADMITAIPDFLLIDLNLSREQTAQIVQLREMYLKDIRRVQEEAFSKRQELHRIWNEKAAEREKIADIQKEVKILRDQMRDKISQYLQEVRKILTPEQRTMLRHYWNSWDGGYIVQGN